MSSFFTARDVQDLREKSFRVIKPISGVPADAVAIAKDGRRTPGGWLLEVEWETGPFAGSRECLTRSEVTGHLVRC